MIRALVVDNNVELCATIEEFLNAQPDMEVVGIAYNGEEALQKIPLLCPDVVVLDITMPRLDGMAVLERLSRLGLQQEPTIIMLTALGSEDIIQRFTELGAHYFLLKPFDLNVLAERIRQFTLPQHAFGREKREVYRKAGGMQDENELTRLLHMMGIPPHLKGYKYLRDAVLMVLKNEHLLSGSLTKDLYPRVAERYNASAVGVEGAIRNAIIAAWENGNKEFIAKVSFNRAESIDRFPTNSIVIGKLADTVRFGERTER